MPAGFKEMRKTLGPIEAIGPSWVDAGQGARVAGKRLMGVRRASELGACESRQQTRLVGSWRLRDAARIHSPSVLCRPTTIKSASILRARRISSPATDPAAGAVWAIVGDAVGRQRTPSSACRCCAGDAGCGHRPSCAVVRASIFASRYRAHPFARSRQASHFAHPKPHACRTVRSPR